MTRAHCGHRYGSYHILHQSYKAMCTCSQHVPLQDRGRSFQFHRNLCCRE